MEFKWNKQIVEKGLLIMSYKFDKIKYDLERTLISFAKLLNEMTLEEFHDYRGSKGTATRNLWSYNRSGDLDRYFDYIFRSNQS